MGVYRGSGGNRRARPRGNAEAEEGTRIWKHEAEVDTGEWSHEGTWAHGEGMATTQRESGDKGGRGYMEAMGNAGRERT